MRVIIEEHQYDAAVVRDVLQGIDALENVEGKVSVHYVGYYYNTRLKDCVFILPKVLLEEVGGQERVFGKHTPESIINMSESGGALSQEEKDFLYKFAVWVYRAIVVFKKSHAQSDIVYHVQTVQAGRGRRHKSNTYLDILLSLIQFAKDNRSYFFFILKNLHSGFNKINWTKTISRSQAVVQGGTPVYLNPVNRRRQINFDEELLIIFFSILNHIRQTYGFEVEMNAHFDLIRGKSFSHYMGGYGLRRLRAIKYKYYSDKALELWALCYAFFEESDRMFVHAGHKEYLLVKNFHIVFEAIIDELVGDNPLPDDMEKEQEDGRVIDHLYTAKGLIESERTYYIGDSKYYKMGHVVGQQSVAKQFTYARNVIQANLDIFLDGKVPDSGISLRDKETEGYGIVPNFFISAKMDKAFNYADDGIEKTNRGNNRHTKRHFENRLFDQDTLLLFHYDVNFLFVLALYARDNAGAKQAWKQRVREMFRNEIRQWLAEDYRFYAMRAHPDVNDRAYVRDHFQQVLGKVYRPFVDERTYSLALSSDEKFAKDNAALLAELREFFFVEECALGKNPDEVLPERRTSIALTGEEKGLALCIVREGRNYDIAEQKLSSDEPTMDIGIAIKHSGATLSLVEGFTKARYFVMHNKGTRYVVRALDGNGPRLVPRSSIPDEHFANMIVTDDQADLFLVYTINKSARIEQPRLHFDAITKQGNSYSPHLVPMDVLMGSEA